MIIRHATLQLILISQNPLGQKEKEQLEMIRGYTRDYQDKVCPEKYSLLILKIEYMVACTLNPKPTCKACQHPKEVTFPHVVTVFKRVDEA
ncbi:MAG: hypothetical protein ACI8RA_003085 [Chlamydiales bacterium]|jgi:hypothetical protein